MHDDGAFKVRLAAAQWQRLAAAMDRREVAAGDLLPRRGDVEPRAYLVESGQLHWSAAFPRCEVTLPGWAGSRAG